MTTITTSAFDTWGLVIWFAILSLMMLFGNVIRRKVKFFRNLLFPTAIIAGFLGLGIKYIWYYLPELMELLFNGYTSGVLEGIKANVIDFNNFLQVITYHALALGFIAMSLKSVKDKKTKKYKGKPVKSGLLIVNTYLLQGILGILLTVTLGLMFSSVAGYSGLLLPLAFGQGPGQANNIGGIFESNGFAGGQAFGLALATIGFVWASVAGVYYINKRAKEGVIKRVDSSKFVSVDSDISESQHEIPVSEAIDKMSIQIIFIFVVYALAWVFMSFITSLIGTDTNFQQSMVSLIWGFNFIFAMLFGTLFKIGLKFVTRKGWMKRKYTNEYMLNRLSGVLFDFMVVASLVSINVEALLDTGLILALLVITTVGALSTYFYLSYTTKRIYPDYPHQAFATMFGNLTGTAPNGIALLREIDPNFDTPAADNLVTGSSTAVMFGAPVLIITGIIYLPGWYYLWGSLFAMIVFFVVFNYLMLRKDKKKEN
jgi:ESS family glutamate:Na+ symporter